jgi:transcriptional regulator with XRE-family HTH domain
MGEQIGRRVGRQIRALRRAAGLTQAELAERVRGGVEPETISRYERASRVPTLAVLEDIARALGTDVDVILSGAISRHDGRVDRRDLAAVLDMLEPLPPRAVRVVRRLLAAHLEGVASADGEVRRGPRGA